MVLPLDQEWRRRCVSSHHCLEARRHGETVHVRNSTAPDRTLVLAPAAWQAFVDAVKADALH
jgi:hypothetical protein